MAEFKGSLPAEGDGEIHKLVQNKIIENALKITRGK